MSPMLCMLCCLCVAPQDADAEIVVITSATMYCSSRLAMRSKVYSVLGSIRWGCSYGSCVVPPSISPTGVRSLGIFRLTFHTLVLLTCGHVRRNKRVPLPIGVILGNRSNQDSHSICLKQVGYPSHDF